MSAFVIAWFSVTSAPSSSRSPALSRVVIFTLASVSPPSTSAKPKSEAEKVYAVSLSVLTVLFEAVGAVLEAVVGTSWTTQVLPLAALRIADGGFCHR